MTTKTSRKFKALVFVLIIALLIPIVGINKETTISAQTQIRYGEQLYNANVRASVLRREYVYYSTYTEEEFYINGSFPKFYNCNSSINNACAPVAGTNLLGFYDRYYDEIIPNYTAGLTRGTIYTYYPMAYNYTAKQNVINELYNLMGTNVPVAGTTQEQYKSGLASYIYSKGRNVIYTTVMSEGNINFEDLDANLRAGKPISLFCSGYNITNYSDHGEEGFEIGKLEYDTNHIMICYGYKIFTFYDANNNIISTKTLLMLSTGLEDNNGYYLLNNNGTINDAEVAYVY